MAGNFSSSYVGSTFTQGVQTNLSLSSISFEGDQMNLGGTLAISSGQLHVQSTDSVYISIKILRTDTRASSSTPPTTAYVPVADANITVGVAKYQTGTTTITIGNSVPSSSGDYIYTRADFNQTTGTLIMSIRLDDTNNTTLNAGDYITFLISNVGNPAGGSTPNKYCNWLAIPIGYVVKAAGTGTSSNFPAPSEFQ